jgi:hypothetical protein
MSMLEMGIPKAQAELALEETGGVGVEVATEWLFSLQPHVLSQHLAERGQGEAVGGAGAAAGSPVCQSGGQQRTGYGARDEVRAALEPRRVPVTVRGGQRGWGIAMPDAPDQLQHSALQM